MEKAITMNGEVWATIRGCNGYAVSNMGRVKNTRTGMLVKGFPNNKDPKKAYLQVRLGANNYLVHVLVMETFSKRPSPIYEIDHIDNNRQNNVLSNLQWLTRSQNCRKSKLNSTMVKKIFVSNEDGTEQMLCGSQTAASRMTGITPVKIAKAAHEAVLMTKPDAPDDWDVNGGFKWRNFAEPLTAPDGRKWYFTEVLMITDDKGNVTWRNPNTERFPSYLVDGTDTLSMGAKEIAEADRKAREATKRKGA